MSKQVRASDPTDTAETIIQQRAEVRSPVGKVNKFFEQYGKIIIAVLIAISGWFMREVVKPLQAVPAVVERQAKFDTALTTINYKLDQANSDRNDMKDILAALAALQCEASTPRERRTSILCRKLTNGETP